MTFINHKYPYIAVSLQPLAVSIADLHEDPANARIGHDVPGIKASLQAYGQRKPIVVNRLQNNKIEAGNGTYRAAKELGWSHIAVVFVEDDPATAAGYGIADNRLGDLSEWDVEVLREIIPTAGDLFTGFKPADLNDLVGVSAETETPAPAAADPGGQPDKAEELQAKWQVQPGQVYQLGKHRIMCGDSTQRADVERLMAGELAKLVWTDAPWNVDYGGSEHPTFKKRQINNDNLGEQFVIFVELFIAQLWRATVPGAIIYAVMGGEEWPVIDSELRKIGFHWSSTIVWVKDQMVLSRKDYHAQYEPIWYGWKGDAPRVCEVPDRKQSDTWFIDRPRKSEEHPMMKPLELVERAILNSSKPGDVVLDLFSGSGTTLAACERTGRVCRAMDNDPKYVAVGLERWSQMTGQQPVLEES